MGGNYPPVRCWDEQRARYGISQDLSEPSLCSARLPLSTQTPMSQPCSGLGAPTLSHLVGQARGRGKKARRRMVFSNYTKHLCSPSSQKAYLLPRSPRMQRSVRVSGCRKWIELDCTHVHGFHMPALKEEEASRRREAAAVSLRLRQSSGRTGHGLEEGGS